MNAQARVLDAVEIVNEEDGDPDTARYRFVSKVEGRVVELEPSLVHQPAGIRSAALKAGIKHEDTLDFTVVKLPRRVPTAGVFTRNRSVSPAVTIDREHLQDGHAQALAVISKNANVFTPTAYADARELARRVADALAVQEQDVLVSCTGVIGQRLPMARVRAACEQLPAALVDGIGDDVARAILTTDRDLKVASVKFGDAVLAGMAKGAGMIEPNMATMLVYLFTNLALEPSALSTLLKRTVDATFNAISVDTDTSTSDTVLLFSTHEIAATPDLTRDLESALAAVSLKLARDIVYQAEGATKLIEVSVTGCAEDAEARLIAKQVVNSPLLKSAIFGADPNWGRIVMAMGKPGYGIDTPFDPSVVRIRIDGALMFAGGQAVDVDLDALSKSIRARKRIQIHVELGGGPGHAQVWGCDLSYDYVRINADYTS